MKTETRLLQRSYEVFYRGLALKSIFFLPFRFQIYRSCFTTYIYYTSLNKLYKTFTNVLKMSRFAIVRKSLLL